MGKKKKVDFVLVSDVIQSKGNCIAKTSQPSQALTMYGSFGPNEYL